MVLLLLDRLCGCDLRKALDVPCFDKDSTVFCCLSSCRLWSSRKTISSCPESAGLRQNMITHFFLPLSACLLSFFVFFSSSHSLVSCLLLHIPPIFSHLFFFYLFYPSLLVSALTIFLKECWVVFPVCLSCHRYHQLFFTHILPRVSILPSWHKTNTDLGMSMSTQGRVFISGAQDTDLQCLNEVTPAVVEIRPKCVLGIKQ